MSNEENIKHTLKPNENPDVYSSNCEEDHSKYNLSWNEEYSKRLAAFMNNSNSLLANIDKNFKYIKQEEVNQNRLVYKNPKSITNSSPLLLSDFKGKLSQIDDPNVSLKEKQYINESPKLLEERLRIDELETQLEILQKRLNEKEINTKTLQHHFHKKESKGTQTLMINKKINPKYGDEYNITNEVLNSNISTEKNKICDRFYDMDTNHSETKNNQAECNTVEYYSIKDYNPHNPIVLQNKIKDLESQIQDLQEANENFSHYISTMIDCKIKNPTNASNSMEFIEKNRFLYNEIEKMRKNSPILVNDEIPTKFLQKELDYSMKESSSITNENNKALNVIYKIDFISENDTSDEDIIKKEKKYNQRKIKRNLNHVRISGTNVLKNSKNNFNQQEKKSEFDKYFNSVIPSDDTNNMKEMKKNIFTQEQNEVSKDVIHLVNFNKFGEFNNNIKNTNSKFSTLGMTAFAPRNGSDIVINDIVKFIRQGGRISKGLVHFVGHLPKRNDIYLGVELDFEDGKHDGVYEGKRFFHCKQNKGVFVAFNKIIMAYSKDR